MKITDNVNLLYPDNQSLNDAKKRMAQLKKRPQDYLVNLETQRIAMMIMPQNPDRVLSLMSEMNDDVNVLNYRLDCLDDFINQPQLGESFRGIMRRLSDNNMKIDSFHNSPDSFMECHLRIESLREFIECIKQINQFYSRCKGTIKSAALIKMFEYFENIPKSDSYKQMLDNLSEISEIFSHSIRSVKIGINFTHDMIPETCGILEISNDKIYPKDNVLDKFIFKTAKKADKFIMPEHDNSMLKNQSADFDTALFKELGKYTKEYAARVSASLKEYREMFFTDIVEIEHQLDFYDGAVSLVHYVRGRGLPMTRPELLSKNERKMFLENTYDLCLFRQAANQSYNKKGNELLVTNNISMDGRARLFLVTGANNGGKTTFARGVGICQLLAQTGLYVPCSHAEISPCDFIFTHFPQEEKVGINTSRFTNEIKQLSEICDFITPDSMVILNESIQSTTPEECIEIAAAHLEIFAAAGVRGMFVTHLNGVYPKSLEINTKNYRTKISSIVAQSDKQNGERLYRFEEMPPQSESLAQTVFKTYGARLDLVMSRIQRESI